MKYRDPKPDIQRIEEIVSGVIYGDIKLPKFQRPFVWKRKDVIKLLDSIYNGYPIGSILLWQSSEPLASERTIADLEINTEKDYLPTNYLLDGQQRISSLCGCLYWNSSDYKSLWNVAFDLDKQKFIYPKDDYRIEYFPLNKLLNTSDFINQCSSFEAHPKKEKFYKNAEKLLRSIKDYKIAVVKIGEMTINEVAPIFERINSTGRKLTIVDLMRAATWKGDFDLNDAIKKVNFICEEKGYFEISENHILRNISACAEFGINREDIDKLRSESSDSLLIASDKCAEAYGLAIDYMKLNLPMPSAAYLPYSLQLTYLVEMFNVRNELSDHQVINITKWFWRTAISRHFGTSNTGQNSRDLESVRMFAVGNLDEIPIDKEISIDKFVFDDFRLNIANSKSFVLVLAQRSPRDLVTGSRLHLEEFMTSLNRSYFHKLYKEEDGEHKSNSCINIFVSTSQELDNYSGDELINQLYNLHGDDTMSVLQSQYIDEQCVRHIREGNRAGFCRQRKNLIAADVIRLTGTDRITGQIDVDIYNDEDEEGQEFIE
ncbi:MAG: DUF262 domain-containing protein [Bacteroidota bacterium]